MTLIIGQEGYDNVEMLLSKVGLDGGVLLAVLTAKGRLELGQEETECPLPPQ